MLEISLDMYQSFAVAAIVFFLGSLLVKKSALLKKYCIPAPVVGGLIFAILHLVLRMTGVLGFTFDTLLQGFFMTIFFTTVGFTAAFKLLAKGGKMVLLFLLVAIIMCVFQDAVGAGLATLFGLDPRLGLCVGSIPLVGGHGTAGSFGPMLAELGVEGAEVVSISAATFGLVAGSMLGGPLARRRITKHNLKSEFTTTGEIVTDGEAAESTVKPLDTNKFANASIFLAIAMGAGTLISMFIGQFMTFPSYIGAMVAACIIRNGFDIANKEIPEDEIQTIGGVSLSLFLSFALMNLKLWELAELALPMIVMLIVQTLLMAFFAYFLVFNLLGRDYEAAVMTTAFCGFGMGATPNAMANMQAVTNQYGAAPRAFFVVPLVGSLFIDFFNAGIITAFTNFLG